MNKEQEFCNVQEKGLRILEEAAIVASHELAGEPSGRAEFLPDGAFIVKKEPADGTDGSNGDNGYNHNGHTSRTSDRDFTCEKQEYPLSKVAADIGVVAQHIINLINRFDIIQPRKSTAYSPRETYVFTSDEYHRVGKFFRIRKKLHKSVREAVEMLQHDADYTHAAEKLHEALKQYDGDPESWMEIVEALSLSPALTSQERDLLLLIEGEKKTPLEAGVKLGIKSEQRVTRLLASAQAKAGKGLFDLYKYLTEL